MYKRSNPGIQVTSKLSAKPGNFASILQDNRSNLSQIPKLKIRIFNSW